MLKKDIESGLEGAQHYARKYNGQPFEYNVLTDIANKMD